MARNGTRRARTAALAALTVVACRGISTGAEVVFPDEIEDSDLSAVVLVGDKHLLVASDEDQEVRVLERTGPGWEFKRALPSIELPVTGDGEIDIEAIAVAGRTVYVTGSHSLARRSVQDDEKQERNRTRILTFNPGPNRQQLFRFELDAAGRAGTIEATSLGVLLRNDPILGLFTAIPSKENGIDIEGLAVEDGVLYVGFRSPVLRGNYAPVLKTAFVPSSDDALLLLDLAGRGIRDLVAISSGFLVLAGPPGDATGDFAIYHWNGKDGIAGTDRPEGVVTEWRSVPTPEGANAEGIAVAATDGACYELIVLFDGVPGGAPELLRACPPGH